jgi:hypothetical protein
MRPSRIVRLGVIEYPSLKRLLVLRSRLRLAQLCARCLMLFWLAAAQWVQAQDSPGLRSPVKVALQPEAAKFWRVHQAGLQEQLTGTTGYLDLENISGTALKSSILYAEYFDDLGRFCFSLVYSQDTNVGIKSPVSVGEIRKFNSIASGLVTASEPVEAHLYFLEYARPGSNFRTKLQDVAIRAPVTLSANVASDALRLQLHSEAALTKGPVAELILARVKVDARGNITGIDILNAASGTVETWFKNFAPDLSFYPATRYGVPESGQALVSVRAIVSDEGAAKSLEVERTSKWVSAYVSALNSAEVPPVTEIIFQRPSTKVRPRGSTEDIQRPVAPPGVFELTILGSEWSIPAYAWVTEPSMPQHTIRKLAVGPPIHFERLVRAPHSFGLVLER